MTTIEKYDVVGLKKFLFPFLFFFLASIYLLTATNVWDSMEILLLIFATIYTAMRQPNPWGVVTISEDEITGSKTKIAREMVDWEGVDLTDKKIHLYPIGKSWADGVKINMKVYPDSLRARLEELRSEYTGE